MVQGSIYKKQTIGQIYIENLIVLLFFISNCVVLFCQRSEVLADVLSCLCSTMEGQEFPDIFN